MTCLGVELGLLGFADRKPLLSVCHLKALFQWLLEQPSFNNLNQDKETFYQYSENRTDFLIVKPQVMFSGPRCESSANAVTLRSRKGVFPL